MKPCDYGFRILCIYLISELGWSAVKVSRWVSVWFPGRYRGGVGSAATNIYQCLLKDLQLMCQQQINSKYLWDCWVLKPTRELLVSLTLQYSSCTKHSWLGSPFKQICLRIMQKVYFLIRLY